MHVPTFLSRLEFWVTLLDLLGLAVLMSQDVEFLKFIYTFTAQLPPLKRWQVIEGRVQTAIKKFVYASPAIQETLLLETFRAEDAKVLISLFPIKRSPTMPDEVDLCACFVGMSFASMEIMVWLANKGTFEPILVSAISDTELGAQLEKKKRNFTYTAGFTLMAVSSLLYLAKTIVNNI